MRTGTASRGLTALVLAAAALALSACGSSGESKKDFIARADAICNNATRDLLNVAAPATTGTVTLPALAKYLGAVVPIVASEAKQLNALPRPAPATDRRSAPRPARCGPAQRRVWPPLMGSRSALDPPGPCRLRIDVTR